MNVLSALIIGRTLTNMGDKAWDLAVPLAMAAKFQGNLGAIAAYSLPARVLVLLCMPRLGARLDRTDRLSAVRLAIALHTVGTASVFASLVLASEGEHPGLTAVALGVFGGMAGLGAASMNVALGSDWRLRCYRERISSLSAAGFTFTTSRPRFSLLSQRDS